jgi:Fic family protein
MIQKIYTFSLSLTMKLWADISKVDRFDAAWSQIEKREGETLKQLKAIATVRSVGASTRIEGSKMTDAEVQIFIEKIKISTLEERDEQEVAGYFEALDTIAASYKDIEITAGNIKNLHNILMAHSEKDAWHRGDYKQVSNAVEASYPDGSKQIVFKTTDPGLPTITAMEQLLAWYQADGETLPVVKAALFVYDFLSIHPFQDGNGRLSRLLGTLLLLRHGYSWIQYVSFEHEIENRKAEYYEVLMQTQKQRPGEPVDEWIKFFFSCMSNIQDQLMDKLNTKAGSITQLAPREKNIMAYIENHPGSKSGEIAEKLNIPLSTVKKMLTALVDHKLIIKYGIGAGTNYLVEKPGNLKTGLMFQLTNLEKKKQFLLTTPGSYIEIKEIVLAPLFDWEKPDEWSRILGREGLGFKITATNVRGTSLSNPFYLSSMISLYHFKPKIILNNPIHIPIASDHQFPKLSDFPLQIEIEFTGTAPDFSFDVTFVYDEV